MKVLIISDTPRDGWAIGKLSDVIIRHNPQINFTFLAVHPKEVEKHIDKVKEAIKGVDLIHFQYWNTARQLFEFLPELKSYKSILTHHNQKNTLSYDWNKMGIDYHITHTEKNRQQLLADGYNDNSIIQHGIDLDYFSYFDDYTGDTGYVGYVGRVVPWKGLKEIAWAARQNDMKVVAMGKMDKPAYWAEIPLEDQNNIDFTYNNVPDNERINCYREMMCFVQNSSAGREEGTLPLLEAMACGVPVISTPSGEAADIINDGENGFIVPFENKEALKVKIKMLKDDPELRKKLRENAWQTIKNFTEEKMAREYSKIYYQIYHGHKELVTVITPAFNSINEVIETYKALEIQTLPIAEWIIVDDNSDDNKIKEFVESIKDDSSFAIRYMNTGKEGYNLAMARNMGIIESATKFLMFLDSRLSPDPDAVMSFTKNYKDNHWLFGDKGSHKKSFVENFSFIKRGDLIKIGMFCERIDRYGGMSQEIRARWGAAGNEFKYIEGAKAIQLSGSKTTNKRRRDIIAMKLRLYKMGL